MVRGYSDKVFITSVYIILAVCAFICLFPVLYVLSMSLTPYEEVLRNGGVAIIPKSITLDGYREIFKGTVIPKAFLVNIYITVVGTFINLLLTVLMAYPLSRKYLPGRSVLLFIVLLPIMFGGGLIPTYLVVKYTGLLDSLWAMIIPYAIWGFNLIVMKTFFEGIDEALFESARIDGAGEFRILFQILLPLSLPVMMTVGLYYGVAHWNEFFSAIFYITDRNKLPLQVALRNIIDIATSVEAEVTIPSQTIKMAAVIVVALPIVAIYPFIQKYFAKGMLVGAIKG